jgi:hypothetical protein
LPLMRIEYVARVLNFKFSRRDDLPRRVAGTAGDVASQRVVFSWKNVRKSLFGRMGKMGVNFEKNCD